MSKQPRRKVPQRTEVEVFRRSGRRCCICVALKGDTDVKQGQIAHLDQDPNNNDPDNLCFLCLDHHDQYDTRTSQSKGLTEAEVRAYREQLDKELPAILNSSPIAQNLATGSEDPQRYADLWEKLSELHGAIGIHVSPLGYSNDFQYTEQIPDLFNAFQAIVRNGAPFMNSTVLEPARSILKHARSIFHNDQRQRNLRGRHEHVSDAEWDNIAETLLALDDENEAAFNQIDQLYHEVESAIRACVSKS